MTFSNLLLSYARNGFAQCLKDSAYRKFCRRNKGATLTATTLHGFTMTTIIGDSVDNQIYVHRTYETQTTELIKSLATKCNHFIDIGCNIGYYSCLYCATNPKGQLLAIDPNPKMTTRTNENLAQNNFTNHQTLNCGIASEKGTLKLNVPKYRHSLSSFAYVPTHGGGGPVDTMTVETKTLTDVLTQYNIENALLKIDTEGFEYQVFQGLTPEVAKRISYLIFEFSTTNLKQAGTVPSSLFTLPCMALFKLYRLDEKSYPTELTRDAINAMGNFNDNILLIRNDLPLPELSLS